MRDAISIARVKNLHPKVRDEVFEAITEAEAGFPENIRIRVAQGLRTIEAQNQLFALGRTKVNPDGKTAKRPMGKIVTNAIWESFHIYGFAVDFCLLYDKDNNGHFEEVSWSIIKDLDADGTIDWMEVVNAFTKKGWTWGGLWRTFKDYPHVQKTFGYTWQKLKEMYKPGEYVAI